MTQHQEFEPEPSDTMMLRHVELPLRASLARDATSGRRIQMLPRDGSPETPAMAGHFSPASSQLLPFRIARDLRHHSDRHIICGDGGI